MSTFLLLFFLILSPLHHPVLHFLSFSDSCSSSNPSHTSSVPRFSHFLCSIISIFLLVFLLLHSVILILSPLYDTSFSSSSCFSYSSSSFFPCYFQSLSSSFSNGTLSVTPPFFSFALYYLSLFFFLSSSSLF